VIKLDALTILNKLVTHNPTKHAARTDNVKHEVSKPWHAVLVVANQAQVILALKESFLPEVSMGVNLVLAIELVLLLSVLFGCLVGHVNLEWLVKTHQLELLKVVERLLGWCHVNPLLVLEVLFLVESVHTHSSSSGSHITILVLVVLNAGLVVVVLDVPDNFRALLLQVLDLVLDFTQSHLFLQVTVGLRHKEFTNVTDPTKEAQSEEGSTVGEDCHNGSNEH